MEGKPEDQTGNFKYAMTKTQSMSCDNVTQRGSWFLPMGWSPLVSRHHGHYLPTWFQLLCHASWCPVWTQPPRHPQSSVLQASTQQTLGQSFVLPGDIPLGLSSQRSGTGPEKTRKICILYFQAQNAKELSKLKVSIMLRSHEAIWTDTPQCGIVILIKVLIPSGPRIP